jgi:ketosteroid isomerase-like protein
VTPKAAGAKPTTETIKGLHVLRRQTDGSWKIIQDIWNNDAPPPAPAK